MRVPKVVVAFCMLVAMVAMTAEAGAQTGCGGTKATIVGTDGDDQIVGTSGPDVIDTKGGDDVVRAQGGDDVICGRGGNDNLLGGGGDDWFWGGGGNDRLVGGAGRDSLVPWRGNDKVVGSEGLDMVIFYTDPNSPTLPVRANLSKGLARGQGRDLLREIENITGTTGADRLVGDNRPNVLRAHSGPDFIDAKKGADTIWTGRGGDLVYAGNGNDAVEHDENWSINRTQKVFLGRGRDVIKVVIGTVVDGGGGTSDTISFVAAGSSSGNLSVDLATGRAQWGDYELEFSNFENVEGSSRADELYGDDGPNQIVGMDGDDVLDGRGGDDHLDGGEGTDNCMNGETVVNCE